MLWRKKNHIPFKKIFYPVFTDGSPVFIGNTAGVSEIICHFKLSQKVSTEIETVMNNTDLVFSDWMNIATELPGGIREYSGAEQKFRENYFESFEKALKSKTKRANRSIKKIRQEKEKLIVMLSDFFQEVLDYQKTELDVIFSDQMVESTKTFVKAAKTYDPDISLDDAVQALRNVWILNGLQLLLGKKVEVTASVFAYSMLYPYTDNFLDDPQVSALEKIAFAQRFAGRLHGRQVEAVNRQEEKIYEMVDLIEQEWPRLLYPELYRSLVAIHDAQMDSVCLLKGLDELDVDERLKICINKGGTSVVADGFLLVGDLSPEQEDFLYYYGAYLQLLDDLQDLAEDLQANLMTGFAAQAQVGKLDSVIARAFHFGQLVIEKARVMDSDAVETFQRLMERSIRLFLVEAVQANSHLFSTELVQRFNTYSPLSFEFIAAKSGSFSPYQNPMLEKLVAQYMSGSSIDDFSFLHKKSLLKQQA